MVKNSLSALLAELRSQGILDKQVLRAIAQVPREHFISPELADRAYINRALPIAAKQTISQPYIVARMTQALLQYGPCHKILEIGTGSGYQAAVLAELVPEVYTVERIDKLYHSAKALLDKLGYDNIYTHHGDGYLGWHEHAPYDGIIVTAAAPKIPSDLLSQLAEGGTMIIPVSEAHAHHTRHTHSQVLQLIHRKNSKDQITTLDPVIFVPMLPGLD